MSRRPWMKWFPSDWRSDPRLRACSPIARYVWMEMLGLMHEAEVYGHLCISSEPIDDETLSSLIGVPLKQVRAALKELLARGVYSITDEGTIFSRRMVRDEEKARKAREFGREGGSPKLTSNYNVPGFIYAFHRQSDGAVKIGVSNNPSKRISRVRAQFPGDTLSVLDTAAVADMGAAEARLHRKFEHRKTGEWFALQPDEIDALLQEYQRLSDVHLKGHPEHTQKPHIPEARGQRPEARGQKEGNSEFPSGSVNPKTSDDDSSALPPDGGVVVDLFGKGDGGEPEPKAATSYAFEGEAIRLNQRDFDRWVQAFPNINIRRELFALDQWAGEQGKSWFHAVSAALAKRDREAELQRVRAKATAEAQTKAGRPRRRDL